MVVELGEDVTAHGIYPGGQSGHPGSRFYDNMVQDWATGNYYRLLFVDSPEELASYQLYQIQMKK
jgi:penicillin amidase